MLDSSASVSRNGWTMVKQFVRDMVIGWPGGVGVDGAQVGVVTFSTEAHVALSIGDYIDIQELMVSYRALTEYNNKYTQKVSYVS